MLLEIQKKIRTSSEKEAEETMQKYKDNADQEGYIIKKCGYDYRTKKSQGEIIAEAWIVTVVCVYGEIWGDL